MDKGTEQVDEGIDTLTWVDPPPRMVGRNKRAVNERRLAMDENPGRWLLYRADIGHASGTQYLKQLVEIGVLAEVPVSKEKLFIHPKLMQLLTRDSNEFKPYG